VPDIESQTFTCYIDNTDFNVGMDSFQFNLSSNAVFTDNKYEYDQPVELLAVSDIEGNFYAMQAILQGNKVMDSMGNWTYGTNHIVINGDLIDRGNNVLPCLWLLYKLDAQAKAAGGHVHIILGNHELMNFKEDFRYVNRKYLRNKKVGELYKSLFCPTSVLAYWIRSKNTVEKIGPYLFVHAGISSPVLQEGFQINEINNIVRNNLGITKQRIIDSREKILLGDEGPLWYRGLFYYNEHEKSMKEEEVSISAQNFGIEKIVVGHTLVAGFTNFYDDRVLAIDIHQPYKKSKDSAKAVLIKGDKEFVVDESGDMRRL
jgi:hypothetical protein